MKNFPYNIYSCFLKKKYGEKIYKLPIKINATCPNRDGLLGYGGCIFCGIEGGSFENLNYNFSITEQLEINREKISKKYGVNKWRGGRDRRTPDLQRKDAANHGSKI